jgi:hypothetical protein
MPTNSSVIAIPLFVAIMVFAPIILGHVCRKVMRRDSSLTNGKWSLFGQLLAIAGWSIAFGLGKINVMSYPAAVLLGALLYVPGLFMFAFCAKSRGNH